MPNPTVKYSNGFDLIKVQAALVGRVGWQQPTLAGSPVLSTDNLLSRSGRYFNDGSFHAIVSPGNIKISQENPLITDSELNTLLLNRQRACIQRALSGVFNTPEFVEQALVYERSSVNDVAIAGSGKFVGFEINIAKKPDVTIQLMNATLLFDQDVTFNLYLFKDGKKSPVWQQEVSAMAYESSVVTLTDLYLNYAGNTKGARFYFGYFQDDLNSAQAIQEQVCFNETIMLRAESFMCDVAGDEQIDTIGRSYSYSPYGMNLEVTSFRDFTSQIVQKSALFDELIGLTMAYMTIEQMIYAARSNKDERILKDNLSQVGIQLDLNGVAPISDSPQVSGLKQRIDRELKRVKEQFYPRKKSTVINVAGH
jgi:hypothetical protein